MDNRYQEALNRLWTDEKIKAIHNYDYDALSTEDLYTLTVYRTNLDRSMKEALITDYLSRSRSRIEMELKN